MRKSRFIYYGASAMPEETQEAIKKAGLTFVTRDSTISGEARKQHYIHGVPVGPSSDGIAKMVVDFGFSTRVCEHDSSADDTIRVMSR